MKTSKLVVIAVITCAAGFIGFETTAVAAPMTNAQNIAAGKSISVIS